MALEECQPGVSAEARRPEEGPLTRGGKPLLVGAWH